MRSPTPVLSPTVVSSVSSRPDTQTRRRQVKMRDHNRGDLLSNIHSYHWGMKVFLSWILSMGMQAVKEVVKVNSSFVQFLPVSMRRRRKKKCETVRHMNFM